MNGVVGNTQRNYGLSFVEDDNYIYFLDDDNIIHPNFWKIAEELETDTILGDIKWQEDLYQGDGKFISDVYATGKYKHKYFNKYYCYYNYFK